MINTCICSTRKIRNHEPHCLEARIRELEAENATLRKALQRIADHIGELDGADCARIAWESLNPSSASDRVCKYG